MLLNIRPIMSYSLEFVNTILDAYLRFFYSSFIVILC